MTNQTPPPPPPPFGQSRGKPPPSEEEIEALMRRIEGKAKLEEPRILATGFNYGSVVSVIGIIASTALIVNGCSVRPESSIHQIYQVLCIGFGFIILILSEIASNSRKKRGS